MKTKKTEMKRANAKATKSADAKAKLKGKKLSQIEAAIRVLANADEPMNCKAMVEAMTAKGLWTSPGGATPEATLYASILREINGKGKDARFKKVDRGQFTLATRK